MHFRPLFGGEGREVGKSAADSRATDRVGLVCLPNHNDGGKERTEMGKTEDRSFGIG